MEQVKSSRRASGVLAALSGGACWGFSGACGQYLFTSYGIDPGYLTCIRMLLSGVVLTALCLLRQRGNMLAILKNRRDLLKLLLFAVFGLLLSQYTYLAAISHSNAGTATVLQYTGPILVLLADCLWKKWRPKAVELTAMVLALGGTFLLATHGHPGSMVLTKEALFWGLLSAVGLALYTTLAVDITRTYGAQVVMCYGLLIGGMILALTPGTLSHGVSLGPDGLLTLAGIVLMGTVFAYTAYIYGVSVVGSVQGSLLSSVEPVSATLFAVFWLGTEFQPIDLVGFVCILSTVFLLAKRKKQPELS